MVRNGHESEGAHFSSTNAATTPQVWECYSHKVSGLELKWQKRDLKTFLPLHSAMGSYGCRAGISWKGLHDTFLLWSKRVVSAVTLTRCRQLKAPSSRGLWKSDRQYWLELHYIKMFIKKKRNLMLPISLLMTARLTYHNQSDSWVIKPHISRWFSPLQ